MKREFDYLIAGGGTAGCVLASELSRQGAGEIAIIEAGTKPYGRRIHTPALYSRAFGSRWDYQLATVPQSSMRGRRIAWPRGKMLGGSSGLNAMIYSRGSPLDFESWPEGWRYPDIVRHFEAIERRLFDIVQTPAIFDSTPESEKFATLHPLSERFLLAGRQAGYETLDNHALEAKSGVCRYLRTQRNGRRLTAFDVFLKTSPVTTIESTTVEKVIFHDQKAIGLGLSMGNEPVELRARKAVILAAGAIHTPCIMQKSGLGPSDVLRRSGIEARQVLELVGENLQDHLVFPIVYAARKIDSMVPLGDRAARIEYARYRAGPLTSNIAEVGGFSVLDQATTATSAPEIQWHFTPTHYLEYPTRRDPRNAWTIGVTLLHPQSRGRLYVDGPAPFSAVIDPKYYSEDADLERTHAAIQLSNRIADQPALDECRLERLMPGSKAASPERLEAAIRAYSTTIYHPIGTCAMGSHGDSVVDQDLRVRGIENLYIADASVIPCLPSANPQAIVMMIGSRLASMLA
jgi:choline dehydrogenase